MAIHVGRTLKELEEIASKMELTITPTGKNGRFMKEDYIHPIREVHLLKRYKSLDKIPDHLALILSVKSPMLAKRIDELKPEYQKEIWESNNWYFEEKLNGCRLWVIKTSTGLFLYSRHNSDVDLLPIEYSENILFPDNFNLSSIKENFIIDTEITSDSNNLNTAVGKYGVMTETMLQAVTAILGSDPKRAKLIQRQENIRFTFNIFDCVYYEGQWLIKEPLIKRRKLAMELWKKLSDVGFKIRPVRSNRSNKKQFYKGIIMNGGEGAVAKNINGIYVPDTNRQNDGWIKIKRSVSEMSSMEEAFGDTIDGWISGYEPGKPDKGLQDYVGTLKISTYIKRADGTIYEHEIAYISGFDMKLRVDMTEMIAGIPTLKATYYSRVVEIDGAGVSSRARRFNHAVLLGFRYDKNKDSCIIDEDFLNKLIL
jgi:ATP-dependent DNA ligase